LLPWMACMPALQEQKAGHGGAALSRGLGFDGLSLASTCRGHVVAQRAVAPIQRA